MLKRLIDLDHAALTLHTEGLQIVDIHVEDDADNQEPIPDVSTSQAEADHTEAVLALLTDSGPLPTEEPQESMVTPAVGGNVENVVPAKPRYQDDDDEVDLTIK